jgi:hypothetical protein
LLVGVLCAPGGLLARYALLDFVRADLLRSRFHQAAASAILEVAAEGIGHDLPTKYLMPRARLTIAVSGMNARMRAWMATRPLRSSPLCCCRFSPKNVV